MSITKLESITGIELDGVTGGQNTTKGTAGISVSTGNNGVGVKLGGSLEYNRTDKGYTIDTIKKACTELANTSENRRTGNRTAAAAACLLKHMPK